MSKNAPAVASTLILSALLGGAAALASGATAQAAPVPASALTSASAAAPAAAQAAPRSAHTVGTDVRIRKCSNTSSKLCTVVHTIAAKGSLVDINCWTTGTSVGGDDIWYSVVRNEASKQYRGYVAGYLLDTGHDPAPQYGHCYS